MKRFTLLAALAAAMLVAFLPTASAGNAPKKGDVHVQLLSFNDFHGALASGGNVQIGPNSKTDVVAAGGIAYMAALANQLKAANPNTFVVSGGDNIGASPLVSAIFHDEPTIDALNLLGLYASAVGNHEFDEGYKELLRMQYGGCNAVDGCQAGPFDGAKFWYLTTNVFHTGTPLPLFSPVRITMVDGVPIAFVGTSLEATPSIVTAAGVAGMTFKPEVSLTNLTVKALRIVGIKTIVVLLHDGGAQTAPFANGFAEINGCENPTPSFVDLVTQLDPQVDVVVSGHTHNAYVCRIGGKLVTSALSSGRLLTDTNLTIDRKTRDVVASTAQNLIVQRTGTPDPAMQALVDKYTALSAPLANKLVGSVTANLTRTQNAAGESTLGDVLADAQLYAMQPQGAVAAITNPGGIRTDITYAQSAAGEGDGNVTYGELFAVQPFNNYMVVKDVTGQQLYDALNQQRTGPNAGTGVKMLQVSAGFTYSWSAATNQVVDGTLQIGGLPVDKLSTYRVAMNNFLDGGGDNFTALAGGTNAVSGMLDIDAAVAYFGTHPGIAPPALNRITVVP